MNGKLKISALAVAVPQHSLGVSELESKFGKKKAVKIALISGIRERRVFEDGRRALELIISAAEKVIEKVGGPDGIDAVLVVTQTPEYKFPATACILQDKLRISSKALAYDINLGCSGFVYGLITSYSMIKSGMFKKILLVAGDLTQSTASPEDSSTYPLFGDAYSATILESDSETDDLIAFDYGTDGSGKNDLITHIGGARYRNFDEYRNSSEYETLNNVKYPDFCYMDGINVFEFCVRVVPEMIENLSKNNVRHLNDIDYYFFHQANTFILKHLMDKLNLPEDKVPLSLEWYGNTSSASIPLTMCLTLGEDSSEEKKLMSLLGFGVGYSWAGALVFISPQAILPIIEI